MESSRESEAERRSEDEHKWCSDLQDLHTSSFRQSIIMAPTPLCGSLISSRRSFLALAWTLTTLLSVFSFGVSVFLSIKITNQYNSMSSGDYAEWYNDNENNSWDRARGRLLNEDNNMNGDQQHEGEDRDRHSNDRDELDAAFFASLATTNSRGLVFAGLYTTILGMALSLYGSTVVVGFMSLKGEYLPPCFNFRDMSLTSTDGDSVRDDDSQTGPRRLWGEKIHRGIFLGLVVIFSNLMLLCAVIFGELQVQDNYDNYDEQSGRTLFSYRIEKIASIFAITCMVLAFVYILFAVIYTTCGGLSDDTDPVIAADVSTWGTTSHHHYEMSKTRRRRHLRGRKSISREKQEPLVESNFPTDNMGNDGFITDMISRSSGSSLDTGGGTHSYPVRSLS